jgi:hypothetical protein
MTLLDYGLATPKRPLGNMPWSEFTASVEDEDIRTLSALWTTLRRLNMQYENAVRRRERYAPYDHDDLGRYGKPFLTKPSDDAARGEVIVDIDQLYILTQTGEIDDIPGVGKKIVSFTVDLLNQNIAEQNE